MTFAYQPSAAGISWLTLAQTLDSRTQMEQALLMLSSENSKVQISMTQNSADQTLKELNQQAEGQRQGAIFNLTGAAAGICTSLGTLGGAFKTMPQGETPTIKNSLGVEEAPESAPTTKLASIAPEEGAVQVTAENLSQTSNPTSNVPANKSAPAADENGTKTTQKNALLNRYLSEHGTQLASSMSSGIQSFGNMQQAKYTAMQAETKSIGVITQGLATVMSAQGQALSSAIGSCDTFFNNTEGSFTTIIQVSAVRG